MPPQDGSWILPLTVIPGVAMLINSSATRLSEVYQELLGFAGLHRSCDSTCARSLLRRVWLLRNSLILMYLTVCGFAPGATFPLFGRLMGPVSELWFYRIGLASFLAAAMLLVWDAAGSASLAGRHAPRERRQPDLLERAD